MTYDSFHDRVAFEGGINLRRLESSGVVGVDDEIVFGGLGKPLL